MPLAPDSALQYIFKKMKHTIISPISFSYCKGTPEHITFCFKLLQLIIPMKNTGQVLINLR